MIDHKEYKYKQWQTIIVNTVACLILAQGHLQRADAPGILWDRTRATTNFMKVLRNPSTPVNSADSGLAVYAP